MVRKSGVTLQDLLQLDCMQGVNIVAGNKGLDRVVNNINVMEVPDIANWVNAGDLLLTTAYSIRNDLKAQLNLVPQLAAKGLAGLVLKPKRYLPCIPPEMIEQANQLNFPLLEMPLETSFAHVINPILSEILEMQTSYLQKSEDAHRLFMEVMLKGGGLGNIADTLAKLIDNPVMILADTQEVLATSQAFAAGQPLAPGKKKGPTLLVDPLESGIKYFKTQTAPSVNEYRTAIVARGQTRGYLLVWDSQRPLRQNDFIVIERAMTIIALEVLNEISLTEIERRYRNEFLDELLCKEQASDKELLDRARHLGWDLSLDYVALVLDTAVSPLPSPPDLNAQQAKEYLFQQINHLISPVEKFIIGTKSDSIIVLLAKPEGLTAQQITTHFKQRAGELLKSLQNKLPNFPLTLGLGRFYPGIAGLRRSYSEALKALALGKDHNEKLICFADLGIDRLLQQVTDLRELETFYRETILPLDRHDRLYNTQLVQTLTAYFACNGNLKQASKSLFTHYNTILYRIDRIETITGQQLKAPEQHLNLMVGLKIRRLLAAKGVNLG